jgi:uncharacterized protein (TIGR02145 family)
MSHGNCPVVTSNPATVSINPACCGSGYTTPGTTVNFTAFNPCPTASIGATWYLADTREQGYSNAQTYTVRKLDSRIWMTQDLKFGNICGTTSVVNNPGYDVTGLVTSLTDKTYYGDCRSGSQGRGYYYNFAAAINKADAHTAAKVDVSCNGTTTYDDGTEHPCQGICPNGWHLPTVQEIIPAVGSSWCEQTVSTPNALWDTGGLIQKIFWWNSTMADPTGASHVYHAFTVVMNSVIIGGYCTVTKGTSMPLRCVKNN